MNEKLKSCPFCGAPARRLLGMCVWQIECTKGCVRTRLYDVNDEAMTRDWNTRADHPATPGKKVYRAGDVVPDGKYWLGNNVVLVFSRPIIEKRMLFHGIDKDYEMSYPLIPIDLPKGVEADD